MSSQEHQPVVLFSGLATVKALDDEILEAFTAETGIEVERHYDPTTELQRRMEAGERPDLLIAATGSVPGIAEATGALNEATTVALVTTAIGFGVRKGDAHPPIGTVDELVQTLKTTRSLAYSRAGQSGIYVQKMLKQLGIFDEVEAKATPLPKGFTGEAVVDGRASLAVQQLSELAYVDGVDIVGSLPEAVQHITEFSGVLGAGVAEDSDAAKLLAYLHSDKVAGAYRRSGLEVV